MITQEKDQYHPSNLRKLSRREIIELVEKGYCDGELTLGQSIQLLRTRVAKLKQVEYAQLCGVSLRTLAAIESDKSNPTLQTINQVFKLFGLKVGLSKLHKDR